MNEKSKSRNTISGTSSIVKPEFFNKKIVMIWKDAMLRKIFLDILGNTQFRLCKYMKKEFCKKISSFVKARLTDNEIYDAMHTWVHCDVKDKIRDLILYDNNKYRSENRAEKIQDLIAKYLNVSEPQSDNLNILDVGCAEGAITVMVGKYMKLNPEQMHGCDIEKLTKDNPYQQHFTFKHLSNANQTYKLPYASESHDVVLALMSLHHIPNKESMIKEIKRILKPGGLLIIREHHCVSNGLGLVLDVVHGFYSMVWSKPKEMNNFDEYYANYTHASVLTKILEEHDLHEQYNNKMNDYPRFHRGKVINPLSYYYGVYKK